MQGKAKDAKAMTEPSYCTLAQQGILHERVEEAEVILSSCTLCPRHCHIDRRTEERGFCRAGSRPRVSSYGPHFGEEPPLVGRSGSGTIFFSYCTMRCVYCQNFEISQHATGTDISCEQLAAMMIDLQDAGCHNVNLVTPTHFVPQIIRAVEIAAARGLAIPLVYNTGGYDTVDTLRLLEGVVDIYMPDAKYGRNEHAIAMSQAPGYVEAMKASLVEMHRQVGDLHIKDGLAVRGLIIRHLVLPENLADTEIVMEFIATDVSRDSYVNIMDQYLPMGGMMGEDANPVIQKLGRRITAEEYRFAIRCAVDNGLHRGFWIS
jgi:putative pyruvate formate lyase activating enzyme